MWYVRRKLCTYLAPTLTLSPNGPKRDSTWPTSLRSSIGCIQNNFWAYGTFGLNVHLSCVKISTTSNQTETSFHLSLVTQELHRVSPEWFLILWYVRRKPSTYLALRLVLSPNRLTLTLSPNGPKRDSTWPTSPSSFIVCVQNNFRAYGTFNANHAPILHRD
jgi:hypothetical protein